MQESRCWDKAVRAQGAGEEEGKGQELLGMKAVKLQTVGDRKRDPEGGVSQAEGMGAWL